MRVSGQRANAVAALLVHDQWEEAQAPQRVNA